MKQAERRQIEVIIQYAYLLWRDLPPNFERALRLLPSRLLVQAALKQGQRHRVKRDTQIQAALCRRVVRDSEKILEQWAAIKPHFLPGYGVQEQP